MTERILIVAAHPDDEVLGCGGTMVRHAERGDTVDVVFVADGVTARGATAGEQLDRRRAAAMKAAKALGCRQPTFLDFPDNRLDSVDLLDVVRALERLVRDCKPTIIFTHHGGD